MSKENNRNEIIALLKIILPLLFILIFSFYMYLDPKDKSGGISKVGLDGVEFYPREPNVDQNANDIDKEENLKPKLEDTIVLKKSINTRETRVQEVQIKDNRDLVHEIVRYETLEPISNADIFIPDLNISLLSDSKGRIIIPGSLRSKHPSYYSVKAIVKDGLIQKEITINFNQSEKIKIK